MKKHLKSVSVLTLLLYAMLAQGDVIIYKTHQSGKQIGDGASGSFSATGYLVFDPVSREWVSIAGRAIGGMRYFEVEAPTAYVYSAEATGGKSYTILSGVFQGTNTMLQASVLFYGQNAGLYLSATNRAFSAPRSASGKYLAVSRGSPNQVVSDSIVSLTFDAKDTQSANAAGKTMSQVITDLKNTYLSKGYTQAPTLMN